MLNVAIIQFSPVLGHEDKTINKIGDFLSGLEDQDVIVLPELANSGYNFADKDQAYETSGEVEKSSFISFLHDFTVRNNNIIITGFNERIPSGKLFNSSVMINRGGIAGKYRKIHLFMNEKDYFEPGDLGLPVFEFNGYKAGMLICFDYLFPEVWRGLALKGADIIFHPSNLVTPYGHRVVALHSIVNRIFIVTANRTGTEGELTFRGNSLVTDPLGSKIAEGAADREQVIKVSFDPLRARDKMITARNHVFKDLRPEFYI